MSRTKTFIDSNIVIYAVGNADDEGLVDRALDLITDDQREIYVTSLLALEIYPSRIYRFNLKNDLTIARELATLDLFFAQAQRIEINEELITDAMREASTIYGIQAADALHLTAAKLAGCQEFHTAEKPGKPLYSAKGIQVIYFQ